MTRMKSKVFAAIVPALLLMPAALAAQNADAKANARVQASTPQARIDAAMAAAARASIPVELIESKIAEGRAKAVAEERIATAVEARVAGLVRASEALKRASVEAASAGHLSVAADALDAGVSESAVVRISRDAPRERRAVAVAVLADLVRLGHPADHALTRVSAAASSSAALANLHAEVASQLRLGGMRPTLDVSGAARIR
ncbi:MAG TPA: hypothetical protein VHG09_12970 [Longimicrobiales bacterium]|nr:hypothetical protein [Longimicrobiales bacterium]